METVAKMLKLYIILFSPLLASASLESRNSKAQPIAHIRDGTLVGRYLAEFDQDLFLGIPFVNAPRLNNPTPFNSS
jgi:hypothetical protein